MMTVLVTDGTVSLTVAMTSRKIAEPEVHYKSLIYNHKLQSLL